MAEAQTEPPPWEAMPAEQRLDDVLRYLREQHLYCLFCGCQVQMRAFVCLLQASLTP